MMSFVLMIKSVASETNLSRTVHMGQAKTPCVVYLLMKLGKKNCCLGAVGH